MLSKCNVFRAWLTPKPSLGSPFSVLSNNLCLHSWRSFHALNMQRAFVPAALVFPRQNRFAFPPVCPISRVNGSDVKSNAGAESKSKLWSIGSIGLAIGPAASALCRPCVIDGRRGMAKKSRATQKPKESVNSTETLLEHGVEKVIFSYPSPNQFRTLSLLAGTQLLFWLG